MKCFKCNAELSDRPFCERCGADVSVYKKIMRASDAYYNDGLAKARVRDLTGAARSLRRSVKFNKYNTDARNLLGLVYYETGNAVAALTQWIVSRSLQEKNNAANRYLQELQGNAGALEKVRTAIKKYNMAVEYTRNHSEDLAIIQLKRVLALHPHMLPAYQLLALLYMKNEEYTKAKKMLRRAQQIDTNNTTTLLYLREVERLYATRRGKQENLRSTGTNKDRVTYASGNDIVIQPTTYKEKGRFVNVANLLAGFLIGLAAAWFLVLPGQQEALKEEYRLKEQKLYASLQQTAAPKTTSTPKPEDQTATDAPDATKAPTASKAPSESTAPSAGDAASAVEKEIFGDPQTMQLDSSQTAEDYFKRGSELYDLGSYEEAIPVLQKALAVEDTHIMSLYYLGRAYQMLGEKPEAIAVFERIIELYPDHELAGDARRFIGELQ